MALKVCNGGKVTLMARLVGALNTFTLRLYKNNKTPADTDVVADYTEANFDGYAAIALVAWSGAYLNADAKGESDENVRTFTQTGVVVTNNVYGYYVTDGNGNLVWAERNASAPIAMNANGATYSVLPRLTIDNAP